MSVQGLRLSPQQKRLWLLQAAGSLFRTHGAFLIEGDLDADRLRAALERLVARHEILRTLFQRTPGITVPIQVIQPEGAIVWQAIDGATLGSEDTDERLAALIQRAEAEPMNAERGPLVHATLLADGAARHLLLLTLPAVGADLPTLANLASELALAYEDALGDDEDVVQYADFSEWQHELLGDEEAAAGAAYWDKQAIAMQPPLTLPFAPPVSAKTPFRPAVARRLLSREHLSGVEALATATGSTVADVLLAAWQTLLWRLIGESPVVVGTTFTGRKHEELEAGLGLFATVAPVAVSIEGGMSFQDVVRRVARATSDAADWQEYFPWQERSIPAPNVSYFPLGFEFHDWPAPRHAAGLTFSLQGFGLGTDRYEAKLVGFRHADGLLLELHHDASRLLGSDTRRLLGGLNTLLGNVIANPELDVDVVEILGVMERGQIIGEFNQTDSDYPRGKSVHALFEEQVARTPDGVALVYEGQSLTYAMLNQRANQLAHFLRRQGVGLETLVAVRMERSPELVVGLLGVLKAGGAYVPLDLIYPHDRLAFMLEDTQASVLLTQSTLATSLASGQATQILLDADWEAIAQESTDNPALPMSAEHVAYIIYTSGSTGRPKGVMVPHRGLVNYLSWALAAYGVEDGTGAPVHSPIGFDLTITSLYLPLLAGKPVVLLREEPGVDLLGDALLEGNSFSLVKITPSHLDLLSQVLPPEGVKGRTNAFVIGGEALSWQSVGFWLKNAPATRLINEYGPTETTVGCCIFEVPDDTTPTGNVPIGRPIANTRMYLLDRHLHPVPLGVPGEIYIGGEGVARGYLSRPRQTAERFVPDPFSTVPGARLYRTGDFARLAPNDSHTGPGVIEFLGRNDNQVKVRGYRIELGEIETVLNRHPNVREAAVIAHAESLTDRRLVAYFTATGETPPVDELRLFLSQTLPDYMIPSLFIRLERMALTPNGKVDYEALPSPDQARPELQVAYQAPETPLEQALVDLWVQTLGIERIGVHDNFFALGGDSIRSVRVVALAKEAGLDFTVQHLFQHPSIHALAAHIEASQGEAEPDSEEALLKLLEELEGLSDEEAQSRLESKTQPLE